MEEIKTSMDCHKLVNKLGFKCIYTSLITIKYMTWREDNLSNRRDALYQSVDIDNECNYLPHK